MKPPLRFLIIVILILSAHHCLLAQSELWGTTRWSGATGFGAVFKTNNDGTNPQLVFSFADSLDGYDPQGGLIQAYNGKLYGTTFSGGINDDGVLYEIDPFTAGFTKKYDFSSLNTGSNPMGTLFAASNGKLYGMARYGGISNKGTFFEYDIASNIFTKIVDFDGPVNGSDPYSNTMMEGSNGKLYGTTPTGGLNNKGIIFEYDFITATF